jgi:lipoprotein-anchoring transpeptidase ErfK/SrfK
MSKRPGMIVLAAAALVMMGSAAPASAREIVRYNSEVQPGTIVVKTAERRLYLVLGDGSAIRYTVAVGRPGHCVAWVGVAGAPAPTPSGIRRCGRTPGVPGPACG